MNRKQVQYSIGIGGWEHECFNQCLYSVPMEESDAKLRVYSRYFDTVEVRATFWDDSLGMADALQWIAAVAGNKRFRFNVKLHKSFVHGKEIRPERATRVRGLLQELQKNDRLGAALVQLPYSFTNTGANRYHLEKLSGTFRGFPLYVEFRNESWNDVHFLRSFLRESGLGVVNADLPRINRLMPFVTEVIGKTAYVRLHGRNEKGWLLNGMDTRYDYLYNAKELRELKRRLSALEEKCENINIIFNNTTEGKAIANALQLMSSLRDGKPVLVPQAAAQAFPDLLQTVNGVVDTGLFADEKVYRRAG
ncbi:MAG: DUF72 domain-containing protein [Bacteroidetes bacterium]|nr:DUF72 domain-containing protein [Bacteroidota bacterium]MCW5894217.1 DUF72 domain-containing protein [Bacteroidota bacterium]